MPERLLSVSDADRADLVALTADAVAAGAGIGFPHPADAATVDAYWRGVADDVRRGSRVLLVVRAAGRVVGTVQLGLAAMPNSAHRAEVQKLLVHTAYRGRGVGTGLMRAAEAAALAGGRDLLVLDTAGAGAARLYERLGYTRVGSVPGWARGAFGEREPTTFYYRQLPPA